MALNGQGIPCEHRRIYKKTVHVSLSSKSLLLHGYFPELLLSKKWKIMDHGHRTITWTILGHMFLCSGTAAVMEINLSGLSLT